MALLILSLLSGCSQSKNKYPEINWPEIGAPTDNHLSVAADDSMKISDDAEEAFIYKIKKPNIDEITTHLNEKFGVKDSWTESDMRKYVSNEDYSLDIDLNTGYWYYSDKKIHEGSSYNSGKPSSLSEKKCIEIATEIAKQHGVDLEMFSNIRVGTIEYGGTQYGSPVVVGHDVYFYPVLNNRNVWGIARFTVELDGDGNVASIGKLFPEIEQCATEKMISQKDALQQIMDKKGHIVSETPAEANSVKINGCEIVYYINVVDLEQDYYCQPVYVFKGEYLHNGETIKDYEYVAMVSAL